MIKKCKGTGKAKGTGCGKDLIFSERNGLKSYKSKYGLGLYCCYSRWLYSSNQGRIILDKVITRTQLKRKRLESELVEDRAQEKQRKSLSVILRNLMNSCHAFIRERDKYKPCISCGISWSSKFQAGHFYKAELFPSIKHNEMNIHGQCVQCNIRKEGNESEYRVNLPKRIGLEAFEELNFLAKQEKKVHFKWDREELSRLNKYYRSKIKDI
jgi:hypothetical protein